MFLLAFANVSAQQVPVPTPDPQATPAPQVNPMYPRGTKAQQLANLSLSNVNEQNAPPGPDGLALNYAIVQQYAQPIYRKPTGEELVTIAPSADILSRFHEFLKRPKTGVFRLIPDAGCSENLKVISVTDNCLKYTMPGSGSSFSFRTGNYRIPRLADLTLDGLAFYVTGELMHGILANLGDVPIENVSLRSPGVQYVGDFQPATDIEKARETDQMLMRGIRRDGYSYGRAAAASKDSTYVLRVLAYKGTVIRSVNGAVYNELDFDKRHDVTIVFRTVDVGSDGSFTIIWAELNRADAPKIKTKAVKPSN